MDRRSFLAALPFASLAREPAVYRFSDIMAPGSMRDVMVSMLDGEPMYRIRMYAIGKDGVSKQQLAAWGMED